MSERPGPAVVQRGRMLVAAVEVVCEVGYRGMSVARVTGRAGVSRRTFYEVFEDREDCFLAVFDDVLARVAAVAVVACGGEGCWREKVRAGLASVLWFIGDQPGLGALVVVDALGAGPRVLERRARCLEMLGRIVDEGRVVGSGGGGPLAGDGRGFSPSVLTAEGVVGAVFSVIHARMLEQAHGVGAGSVRSGSSERWEAVSLAGLLNPLMAMIVLPYLGREAAAQELVRPAPSTRRVLARLVGDPLEGLGLLRNLRAYRARACVLYLAEQGGRGFSPSNRQVGEAVGIASHSYVSALLARLAELGLASRPPRSPGGQNAWSLTAQGLQAAGALRDACSSEAPGERRWWRASLAHGVRGSAMRGGSVLETASDRGVTS